MKITRTLALTEVFPTFTYKKVDELVKVPMQSVVYVGEFGTLKAKALLKEDATIQDAISGILETEGGEYVDIECNAISKEYRFSMDAEKFVKYSERLEM